MADHYMLYWRPETAEDAIEKSGIYSYAGSEQFKRLKEDGGDVLWTVTCFDGLLTLVGRLEVDKVTTREEAVALLGTDDIWDASKIALALPMNAEVIREVSIADLAAELRFQSPQDRLNVRDGRVNANQLQAMRRLTPGSVALLQERWSEDDALAKAITPSGRRMSTAGSGFPGQDHIRRVEHAAVEHIKTSYREAGWTVTSVERDRIGFDLLCTRGSEEEHVEVKGTAGDRLSFIMTQGEYLRAVGDRQFVLVVVTQALSAPDLRRFEPADLESIVLEPIAYRATYESPSS